MGDIYGIGNAVLTYLEMFIRTSRQTGRTTHILSQVAPGDIIICSDGGHARNLERILRNHGLENVLLKIVQPGAFEEIPLNSNRGGKIILDHTWVEHTYMNMLNRLHKTMDNLVRHASDPRARRPEEFNKREKISPLTNPWVQNPWVNADSKKPGPLLQAELDKIAKDMLDPPTMQQFLHGTFDIKENKK